MEISKKIFEEKPEKPKNLWIFNDEYQVKG
jgi:hypothetical protein